MKVISVPNYCSFQLSPPGCAPGRSSISNGTRDSLDQWCPRSPCPEGAEGGELEPWHPLQARQGKNRSCSLIHWWRPKHPWTAWCCWKWHAVASFFVTTYCNSFMHKNTLCHSKSAHLASKRSSLLFFLSMCPIYTKNTLKTKKQLVKSISPPRWQKYCLFPNYPCSWFIEYIYPIACIWHMAYGLTTFNHYCWQTTTILLNYITSYHITLHYSIFYRTKLLNSIWQYKWYIYIYYIYILSHYIRSYQIIFLYIPSFCWLHTSLWSFNSRHSPSFFRGRRIHQDSGSVDLVDAAGFVKVLPFQQRQHLGKRW